MGYLRLGLNLHITRLPIFLANLKRIGYEKSKIKDKTRHNKTGCIKQNIETRSTAIPFFGYSLNADNTKRVVLTADKQQGGSL